MKKFLLFLGVSLVSLNAYAVEHVIGISGGYNYSNFDFNHRVSYDYTVSASTTDNPDNTITNHIDETIEKSAIKNGVQNINLEYQARFKNNFIIGLNLTNNYSKIKTNYNNIQFNNNSTELTGEFLFKVVGYKNFTINLGTGLGLGLSKTSNHDINNNLAFNNSKTNNYYSVFNLLVDSEYFFSKKIALFGRFNFNIIPDFSDTVFDTNQSFNTINTPDAGTLKNTMLLSKNYSYGINFGIRYKI